MPVPQSWYATNRRISRPKVTSVRPIAAIARRTNRGYRLVWRVVHAVRRAVRPFVDFCRNRPRFRRAWLSCVRLRSAVCMLGQFPALAGADLDVETGEIVLLSGPNGSGKTTLLRLCAGLLPLRAGTAEVLGIDLARDRRAVRRALALVGHETFCYDDLTVAENLRFASRAAGRGDADADAALERVQLTRQAKV